MAVSSEMETFSVREKGGSCDSIKPHIPGKAKTCEASPPSALLTEASEQLLREQTAHQAPGRGFSEPRICLQAAQRAPGLLLQLLTIFTPVLVGFSAM